MGRHYLIGLLTYSMRRCRNQERRAPASERYADIAYVKIRKAEAATKQKKARCGNNITADTSAVRKTAERTKKLADFHSSFE